MPDLLAASTCAPCRMDPAFRAANVWQGLFEVRETWGGATLTIDANVADTVSPSS